MVNNVIVMLNVRRARKTKLINEPNAINSSKIVLKTVKPYKRLMEPLVTEIMAADANVPGRRRASSGLIRMLPLLPMVR
ncbi:hypothetical protein BLOT_013725 [Blomia tropicalis]|nr:hypothetical protein BLOT_013725 [Blomia tropicalis]